MTRSFADHFSAHAGDYARFRPTYPDTLFAWLADQAPGRSLAWDCGTGNGQAAAGLAAHFAAVRATDPSAEQLASATPHPRVTYGAGSEDQSGLPAGSTDLVTAAQAFHWFDAAAFFAESRRVRRPGGLIAIWCYGLCHVAPAIDDAVRAFHQETVGPYWPQGRELVDTLYATVDFPFEEIAAPAFAIERTMPLAAFLAYVRTWSAVRRYLGDRGTDPVDGLAAALAPLWPGERPVRWPISLRVGR